MSSNDSENENNPETNKGGDVDTGIGMDIDVRESQKNQGLFDVIRKRFRSVRDNIRAMFRKNNQQEGNSYDIQDNDDEQDLDNEQEELHDIPPPPPPPKEITKKIVIIGGGISGLSCAKTLVDAGENDFIVLESMDDVGGRVRTDQVNGYLLDRGSFC